MNKLDKILNKTIVALGIALIIVIAVGYFLPYISGSQSSASYNNMIRKAQNNFTSNEIKSIENSHLPITINPANAVFFGTWKNMSHMLCAKEQDNFSDNFFNLSVLYNGFYVPVSVYVQAFGISAPNLIGQKVYLSFIANNNKNISAPYIVKNEIIKNNIEYWNFTFDGSTSNAINSMLNPVTANITTAQLNGIVLSNHTPLISPLNPKIPYTAPNC